MITTFGVKIDEGKKLEIIKSEKVSQEDVDDLLKEFGF
jgi:chemotaxis regulatin CheY-phosphate phosphatase CheZ